ncbi:hypothetical protein NECAME_17742 [Necator americanus]|uniref:Uncharacterized protein n=1 Tax=Necator americanus TaxID=51031 RepID=W2TJU3_NECAM|nr:hypothetical protein NECAME_17742 [Necator americanus]ETN82345.1 hypothetical protein NECAME_17742 [Necator americanus]
MQSLLFLLFFMFSRSSCLLCNQCGGERHGPGLRLLRTMCCSATTIECAAGLVCLRALVVSPQKSFILSGCHVPEDGLIGCDFHVLPHNASIHRCTCLDQPCQAYFPNGDCPQVINTTRPSINTRPSTHRRKLHVPSSTARIRTTAKRLLMLSTAEISRKNQPSEVRTTTITTTTVSKGVLRVHPFEIFFVLFPLFSAIHF